MKLKDDLIDDKKSAVCEEEATLNAEKSALNEEKSAVGTEKSGEKTENLPLSSEILEKSANQKSAKKSKTKAFFKDLFDLYFTFFKIGLVTFGGGLSMLPILERTLVDKKKWATDEELLDYYAIAQATPGIIAVNVSTFVGFNKRGIIGGIISTLGMISPSIIIITFIAEFISNFESIVWVQKALKGINVAVAGLLTYSVFNLTKKSLKRWWNIFFYLGSFVSIYFFKVNSVFVILASVLIGLILYFFGQKKSKDK